MMVGPQEHRMAVRWAPAGRSLLEEFAWTKKNGRPKILKAPFMPRRVQHVRAP
jgi:hypothetical protein